jgi:hypothetical protein
MKAVKVRIRRGGPGENLMVYPAGYSSDQVSKSGLGGPLVYSGHIARGGAEAWCIIVLDDALATAYDADRDMEIITRAEAATLIDQWRVDKGEPEEVVTDPDRINAIIAKNGAGVALSAEDLKALDPNDATGGITRQALIWTKRLRDVATI